MRRDPEAQLIASLRLFLEEKELIVAIDSHFDGDGNDRADVELALRREKWPYGMPEKVLLEAKSNHSTDSPNTINKIFGQLLKETGKLNRQAGACSLCLGILIPSDAGEWETASGKRKRAESGIKYYQDGFSRIPRHIFNAFGGLVDARYVFAYSERLRRLSVFTWSGFRDAENPFIELN